MKELIIKTTRKKICSEVAMTTVYLGAKGAFDPSLEDDAKGMHYDRVAIVDGDSDMISRFVDESATAFSAGFPAAVRTGLSGETVEIAVMLPDNFDEGYSEALETAIRKYLHASVTAKWLRMAWPVRSAEWDGQAADMLKSASALAMRRMEEETAVRFIPKAFTRRTAPL